MTDAEGGSPSWEGLPNGKEHRTVGSHRAWCYDDAEWCYPSSLCYCCDQSVIPKYWWSMNVGDVLEELRTKVRARLDVVRDRDEMADEVYEAGLIDAYNYVLAIVEGEK